MTEKRFDKPDQPHKDKSKLSNDVPMTQREVDGAASANKQGANPNKTAKSDPTSTINK